VRDVRRVPRKMDAVDGPADPNTGEKQRGYMNPETGQFTPFPVPQGSGQPSAFRGNSAEIQGINELVRAGTITKEQGADFLAGKTVTGPDGAQYFLTPKGIIQRPQTTAPPPGTLSAAPSGGGSAQPGLVPLTGGRTSEGQKLTEKASAEAKLALPDVLSKSGHALQIVEEARTHPGRKSWGATGWSAGIPVISDGIPGTEGRGFVSRVNQMRGKAFLEAFESLKGGGQITQVEGEKATQAITRLDRMQNDKDFESALDDLSDVIKTGRRRAYEKAGVPAVQIEALERAHVAVMKGADRAAVRKRLEENGIQPYGL
jgi:hypothetical protein